MSDYWTSITAVVAFLLHDCIVILLIPVLLLRKKQPQSTIAWIFAILMMPFVGAIFYLAFGNDRLIRKHDLRKKRKRKYRSIVESLRPDYDNSGKQPERLASLMETICPFPPLAGNAVDILTDMNENYRLQLDAIENAKHSIHIEYYIFQPDEIGTRFRQALISAANRGVQVRFLYDAVGSSGLTRKFIDNMKLYGIETAVFIPFNLLARRWNFNFRNHRKIVVVDGEIAFVGGANIGEEYIGKSNVGTWVDMHLKLEGPIVTQMQQVFAEDWVFASGVQLDDELLYPKNPKCGEVYAQTIPGGPDMDTKIYHNLFFSAVTNADRSIRLMTPYFVPSDATFTALIDASRSGVDVQIIVPGKSTHHFMELAGQSFYEPLLENGVKIYEYMDGFLHSKFLSIDSTWMTIGTANFDNRSMILNFEIGVGIYDANKTVQMDKYFDTVVAGSKKIELDQWKKRVLFQRLSERFTQLFSPIL